MVEVYDYFEYETSRRLEKNFEIYRVIQVVIINALVFIYICFQYCFSKHFTLATRGPLNRLLPNLTKEENASYLQVQ